MKHPDPFLTFLFITLVLIACAFVKQWIENSAFNQVVREYKNQNNGKR